MGLANAVKGSDRIGQTVTWSPIVDITGAILTGIIRTNPSDSDNERTIDGTLTMSDGTAGQFMWTYGETDVGTAGTFWVKFTANFGDKEAVSRWEKWRVYE